MKPIFLGLPFCDTLNRHFSIFRKKEPESSL